jgi:transcriptional regulator GlxA family with amidase domain
MENILPESGILTVGILIFDEVEVLDFCGPFEVFSVAGTVNNGQAEVKTRVYNIAQTDRLVKARGGFLVQPHYTFDNHPPLDLLVVPGGWGTRREIDNPVLMEWLAKVTAQTKLNSSVCTGSFLLGKLGLFDDLKVTTHWASLDRMAESFPKVSVQREVRWVDEGKIVSSAGISAGIDMSLHLVERIFGRDAALATARQMEYNWQEAE